jgi:16S rRNA processing protein RimM
MPQDQRVKLGRITTVYGVKGWVKVFSSTEPMINIFEYQPWQTCIDGVWKELKFTQGKTHGKGLIALLEGCEDRDQARKFCGLDISVDRAILPNLEDGDYYWQQLTGLNVETDTGVKLGKVDHLIATGSNDVLVVKGNEESIDRNERLIPYLPDQVITKIDLLGGVIRVDWDPEF